MNVHNNNKHSLAESDKAKLVAQERFKYLHHAIGLLTLVLILKHYHCDIGAVGRINTGECP